ncbi:MAG TPA: UDP-N-acetylmuramoyl-L-alanyl-D-glutamate--2,6-diaminopimelate ligase [Acidobacteriota bacterium]|nr:UDP-N-acetylmuramoyl-L-alanyl-D-glutamate--2,6-diaminopimelate ligase [Acidobacteriota bacterium]
MSVDVAMNSTVRGRTLGALLPRDAQAFAEVMIGGIAYDSRRVRPRDLFFALPGTQVDGLRFAADAVRAGAAAVVAERAVDVAAPVVVVTHARRAMAEASHRFYGHPDRALTLVGVVGTNGKSTVAAGLQTIWETAGIAAGSIGTVDYRWGTHALRATRTTPEAPDLDAILAQMRDENVVAAAIEVSSHALALDRVWGLNFRGGVLTNITRDHLDFHKTFDSYKKAKRLLFERLTSPDAFAAINVDDPAAQEFIAAAATARIITYSADNPDADVHLVVDRHDLDGTAGRLVIDGQSRPFHAPLWGAFNHANIAAMVAGAAGAGLDGAVIARGVGAFTGVTGRLERIPSAAPFRVYVDFAHTPDALRAVLSAARPLVKGNLLVVFGCGGDRDRGKRPEMARAVEQWADKIYLTSDNPRSEDPERIIADTKSGFGSDTHIWCDSDRARAIVQAVADAGAGDVVLLCGKGHEETQEIAGVKHRFSDRETVIEALAAAGHPPQTPSKRGGSHPGRAVGPGGDPSPAR